MDPVNLARTGSVEALQRVRRHARVLWYARDAGPATLIFCGPARGWEPSPRPWSCGPGPEAGGSLGLGKATAVAAWQHGPVQGQCTNVPHSGQLPSAEVRPAT